MSGRHKSPRPCRRALGWRWVPVSSLAAIALLAGCTSDGDSSDGAAATVTFEFGGNAAHIDGSPLKASVLAATLAVFGAATAALEQAFGTAELNQAGTNQPDPAIVADMLSTEIAVRLIEDELTRRGLKAAETTKALAATQVDAFFGDALDGQPAYKQVLADRYAVYVTLDQALQGPPPTDAEVQAEFDRDPARFDLACARHILVVTADEAKGIVTELGTGADFATLAKARSIDTGSGADGGDLGCAPHEVYVPEFDAAVWNGPVGVVQGPVQSQFGYHVLVVTDRRSRSFAEARDDIVNALAPEPFAALQDWLMQQWGERTIKVDPRYGTWDREGGRVIPLGVTVEGVTMGSGPAPTTK